MKNFASELQVISQLYQQVREEFVQRVSEIDANDLRALVKSILRNRACLAKIEQMNSRVCQVSDEWKKCRSNLDPKSRLEIDGLVEAARGQAVQLYQFCDMQARKVQAVRDGLERNLAELGKGARYLKSIKPIKSNYPKFIDSMC